MLKKLFTAVAAALMSTAAYAEITVDAAKVIRDVPPTLHGTNIHAHTPNFATNAEGIDYQGDLKAAKVKVVRMLAYPDYRKPEHGIEYFDRNVKAVLDCGAQPLFIQYLNPGQKYFNEDGVVGTPEKPGAPQTNLVQMVQRYMAAPYNLQKQWWEVGNEPDYKVDYKMTAEDYAEQFNRTHEALVKAGLRDNVVLCGPVTSQMYWARPKNTPPVTPYIDTFLEKCAHAVDVIDVHSYCTFGGPHEELLGIQRIDKFDARFITDRQNTDKVVYDQMNALLAKMDSIKFARPNVGVSLTEYGAMHHDNPLTGGLWNLGATQGFLYNPRGVMTNSFLFDAWGRGADTLHHYDGNKKKNYLYWALWIAGNLRGDKVIARQVTDNEMPDGRPWLLVGVTKDDQHLYVEVINRSTETIKDKITINGAAVGTEAQVHVMADGVTPDGAKPAQVGGTFEYEFPAASATVIKLPLQK